MTARLELAEIDRSPIHTKSTNLPFPLYLIISPHSQSASFPTLATTASELIDVDSVSN